MMYRSFVDLVFIVVCALAVVLSQSVSLRGLKADPVDVDAAGSERVDEGEICVLVVGPEDLAIAGRRCPSVAEALGEMDPSATIVVVPESDAVSHHRMVAVWWEFHRGGRRAELGVQSSASNEAGS